MKNFENYFNSWINDKVKKQLEAIDIIANEVDIDAKDWFKNKFMKRQINNYACDEFLDVILDNFLCHLSNKFDSLFENYLPVSYKNIYEEYSYGTYMSLVYNIETAGVQIDFDYEEEDEIKEIEELIRSISVDGKVELMKNKLFSYIINQTKLEIFSKKDIRYLKLKKLSSDE
jgi:hypothetical protein